MSPELDPYREWLGIKSPQRPPTHYQLLDLKLYDSDRERIENAEMIQMAKVLRHEAGPHAALAARIGKELAEAVRCLSDPMSKAGYDADMFLAKQAPPTEAVAVASTPKPLAESGPSSTASKSYDFSNDLKLAEEEEDEPTDNFSADLTLPNDEPEGEPEDEPQPDAREPPTGEGAAQSKRAGRQKASPEQRRPASRAPMEMPTVSARQLGIAGAVIAVGLALWFGAGLFTSSGPDAADVLAMIEDADPQTRINGINNVRNVEIDGQQTTALLVKVLKEDQVDEVRVAAANALVNGGIPNQQLRGELKSLLATEQHTTIKPLLQWLVDQK